ncbi:hypothetical protein [Bacillus cereus]|uniref:hypothetical protein n=1 Tax=Bacillus cereus TaxID=1396 RepID=UPI00211D5367|nr:hypothetical protein [Bacillus cereus]
MVTAFSIVPAISVKDPHYGNDTVKQIKENPYYMVVKKQWWKKQESYVLAPSEKYIFETKTGIKQIDQETATKTVSWSIGADMGFSFKGFSLGLSTQYSTQLQNSISHTTEQLKEEVNRHEIINPFSERMAYSRYILTTEYSVQRKNGEELFGYYRQKHPKLFDKQKLYTYEELKHRAVNYCSSHLVIHL